MNSYFDFLKDSLFSNKVAFVIFAFAVLHTFFVGKIIIFSRHFKKYFILEKILHLLGEVEVVFGFWALVFILFLIFTNGISFTASYLGSVSYVEPIFVFLIMCMTATQPIQQMAQKFIFYFANLLPFSKEKSFYGTTLFFGPLLGSLITEPAAMTLTALLLKDYFFSQKISKTFRYVTIGLLFVNVSIGGLLTTFAAPPVLMVAKPWGWDTLFMLKNFGWKSVFIVTLGTVFTILIFRKQFLKFSPHRIVQEKSSAWIAGIQCLFIACAVYFHQKILVDLVLFLFFLGWCQVTQKYQTPLQFKQSFLVCFFLAGLVTLGGFQEWWLRPLLSQLSANHLFFGSIVLTAVTDNAVITYLSTFLPHLNLREKYLIVAGAMTGGGLTVIANAPNLSGYGILKNSFAHKTIEPLALFLGALPFTFLAMCVFWVF